MISVAVSVHAVDNLQSQLVGQVDIAFHSLQDWIDDHSLLRSLIGQNVGVGAARAFKELSQNQSFNLGHPELSREISGNFFEH
eukprot:767610-Hanusia_phi.AAC.5